PPRPGAGRVIRARERGGLGSLDTRLRGDGETIVARALEKDRARRYPSAGELAADIRRHLRNEPIRARPPSVLYQLGKFARRYKALVGGVAAVILALVAGLIGTTLFAMREARQRGQAEHNAALANEETTRANEEKTRADEEKTRADEEKKEALSQKQAALRQAYRANLAAAVKALQDHNVVEADRHLDDKLTEALRDWEWRHLHSRLDDSSAVLRAPPGKVLFLFPHRDELRLGTVTRTETTFVDLDGREVRKLPAQPYQLGQMIRVTPRGLWVFHWSEDKSALRLMDEDGKVWVSLPFNDWRTYSAWAMSPDH